MRSPTRSALALAVLSVALATSVDAQMAPLAPAADPSHGYMDITRMHVDYRVETDGSYVETSDRVARLLSEQAVHAEGQLRVPYSSSLDTFEVLEARTIKANGQRVDVPKQSIFVQDGLISQSGLTSFQDIKTTVIVFPQLEAGDSIQLRSRVTRKRASLPGVFSTTEVFSGDIRYGDVAISVDAPATLGLQVENVGLQTAAPVVANGRRVQRWTYANDTIERTEEDSVDQVMYRPRLLVSSLTDYAALARASQARFDGKATVTPAIAAMSRQIVNDAKTPLEKAQRIHEWVERNVRYFAVVLDVGGYVPRPADEVLSSRFGDCKDHTVLLQALLAAQGIDSVPALLTTEAIYDLPKVPVMSTFNHVIPYVPSLGVFLETNARTVPFGVLSHEETDKPVLLLRPVPGVTRTPAATPSTNQIELTTRIDIRPDGTASGSDIVKSQGASQMWYAWMNEQLAGVDPVQIARKFLIDRNMPGEGTISAAPAADNQHFEFSLLYELMDAADFSQENGLRVVPPLDTFEPMAKDALSDATTRKVPYMCSARTEVQKVTVVFPRGTQLTLPPDASATGPYRTYTSTYRLVNGNEVHIERRFVSTEPHGYCLPEEQAPTRAMQAKILRDLRAEIRYSKKA